MNRRSFVKLGLGVAVSSVVLGANGQDGIFSQLDGKTTYGPSGQRTRVHVTHYTDLPVPVNGVINLMPDTDYIIVRPVLMGNGLSIPATTSVQSPSINIRRHT